MSWKATPDDSKSLVITAKGAPPNDYEPPEEESWPTRMRKWLESIIGRDLPELPIE